MLDKAIESGKEHRKQYRSAKAIDRSCRNHKSCTYCRDARLFFDRKQREYADQALKTYQEDML